MVNILQSYMIRFHIVGDYKHFNTLLDLVYRLVSFMAQLVHVLAGFNRWDEQQIYGTAVTFFFMVQIHLADSHTFH